MGLLNALSIGCCVDITCIRIKVVVVRIAVVCVCVVNVFPRHFLHMEHFLFHFNLLECYHLALRIEVNPLLDLLFHC